MVGDGGERFSALGLSLLPLLSFCSVPGSLEYLLASNQSRYWDLRLHMKKRSF